MILSHRQCVTIVHISPLLSRNNRITQHSLLVGPVFFTLCDWEMVFSPSPAYVLFSVTFILYQTKQMGPEYRQNIAKVVCACAHCTEISHRPGTLYIQYSAVNGFKMFIIIASYTTTAAPCFRCEALS